MQTDALRGWVLDRLEAENLWTDDSGPRVLSVAALADARYKEPRLRKRAAWEEVWALQRREDAGETLDIAVPPKYKPTDFKTTAYWCNRGKLDVPTEWFILYPGAGREGDKTPVLGWAGWDHVNQAQALARLVIDRQNIDGWDTARIEPLLAGLVEIEPWLHQWHNDYDAAHGGSPAEFYRAVLDDQLDAHGLTRDKVTAWRP